jgi:hypothetical protein
MRDQNIRIPYGTNRLAALALVLIVWTGPAGATSVFYEATDLADVEAGSDLWRLRFGVYGFDHGQDHGVSLLFAPDAYESLALVSGIEPGPDWDALVLQPEPGLAADGLYDVLALVPDPSDGWRFAVDVVWKSIGTPGPQPFIIYDQQFATIESGMTVLPEPSTAALVGLGLVILARRFRR